MARYLISFDDGWMRLSGEDLRIAGETSRAVVREAKAAGAWIFGPGIERQRAGRRVGFSGGLGSGERGLCRTAIARVVVAGTGGAARNIAPGAR